MRLVDKIKERKEGTLEKDYPEVVEWFERDYFLEQFIYKSTVSFKYNTGDKQYPCWDYKNKAVPPNLIMNYLKSQGFLCEFVCKTIVVRLVEKNND